MCVCVRACVHACVCAVEALKTAQFPTESSQIIFTLYEEDRKLRSWLLCWTYKGQITELKVSCYLVISKFFIDDLDHVIRRKSCTKTIKRLIVSSN